MKKRVLFLRSTSIIDDSRAIKEINALVEAGYQVTIYGWDRIQKKPEHLLKLENGSAKLEYCEIPCSYGGGLKNAIKMLKFEKCLMKYLKRNHQNYDIIHSCDLDTGIAARIAAKKYNKKLVYDIFDYYIDAHKFPKIILNVLESQEIKTINQSDITIVCTEKRKEQIKKASPKNLIVIHNSPEISTNLNSIDFPIKGEKKSIKITYVGILQDFRLLKEVAEQIKNHDEFELHIGGFGIYDDYFKKMAKENKNIYFYGSLEYSKVLKLENQSDILFATYDPNVPNHKYSAPNKVYEAMALGKPIIVCKNTGIDTLVVENNFGLAIEYDGKDFIKAIRKIVKNNYSKENIQKVYHAYSWDIMKKRLIDNYKKIIM